MVLQQGEKIYGINYIPESLTAEEENEFIKLMERGDANAKRVLIIRNLRLVKYITKRFANTGIKNEDLMSIGTIGLIKGVETFKSDLNVKLATYITKCIQNEILTSVRKNKKCILGDISLDEVIVIKKIRNLKCEIIDTIEADNTDKEYELYENMQYMSEVLDYILNGLETKQKICILYFIGGYTQEIIAKKIGFTQSCVSRKISSASKDVKALIATQKKLHKRKYIIEVYSRLYYKVSVKIDEIHKYNKVSEIISVSEYQAIYKPNEIEIFINAENEAMALLAEITQILEG